MNELSNAFAPLLGLAGFLTLSVIAIFAIPLWMIAIKLWNWHDDEKRPRWYESN